MTSYLGIYLRDQHALGVVWRELARRAQRNNRGTELGRALEGVADSAAADVETVETVLRRVGSAPSPVKTAAALAGERVGRLKPNGNLRTFSPLSRFLELDALVLGLEGRTVLWRTLRDAAGLDERWPDIDFDELVHRAADQRAALEPFRAECAVDAFAGPTSGPRRGAP